MENKDLIVFAAHIDDVELSFWGYISKHYDEYDKIKVIIASDWEPKHKVWEENLDSMNNYISCTTVPHRDNVIEYTNLGFNSNTLLNSIIALLNFLCSRNISALLFIASI